MKTLRIFIFLSVILIFIITLLFLVYFNYPKPAEKKNVVSPNVQENEKIQLKKRIGFLPTWSVTANVKVDTGNFTDIYYFGLGFDVSGQIVKSTQEYRMLNSLFMKNLRQEMTRTDTKFSVVIKSFDEKKDSDMFLDKRALSNFEVSLASLIDEFKLDGVNFDFEYPADSKISGQLLSVALEKISANIKKTYPNVILSFDISGNIYEKENIYDVEKIGRTMDYLILMGYDYKTPDSVFAGPTAPLLGEINDHTISESTAYMTARIKPEKIILGIPLYGYEWETRDETYKSPVVLKSGALATIKRVQKLLSGQRGIAKHWDDKAKSPWLSYKSGNIIKQVYYEDMSSIKSKAEFAGKNSLAGVAFWALGYEGDNSEVFNIPH